MPHTLSNRHNTYNNLNNRRGGGGGVIMFLGF